MRFYTTSLVSTALQSCSLILITWVSVCLQHDAIDLMTTKDHLLFYARVKGVADPKRNTKENGYLRTHFWMLRTFF
jgi:hypothetical protein